MRITLDGCHICDEVRAALNQEGYTILGQVHMGISGAANHINRSQHTVTNTDGQDAEGQDYVGMYDGD